MIQKITSRANDRIKNLMKLYDAKVRHEKGLFIVEGFHAFEMALLNKLVVEVYTLKEIDGLDEAIKQYLVTPEIMLKIAKTKDPQGVISVCQLIKPKKIKNNHVLYLDDINDPGNLGTILRSALAFNYRDIILSHNTCDIYNPKVLQSTQGAIFNLNIIEGDINSLKELQNDGYELIATALKSSVLLDEFVAKNKHVLIMGNESHGVSKEVLDLSNVRVRIDIDNIDSLNVGVASGIFMNELRKR